MITRPPSGDQPKTEIHCDRTGGYTVKQGLQYYQWCPFCGYPTAGGDDHEIVLDVPS